MASICQKCKQNSTATSLSPIYCAPCMDQLEDDMLAANREMTRNPMSQRQDTDCKTSLAADKQPLKWDVPFIFASNACPSFLSTAGSLQRRKLNMFNMR